MPRETWRALVAGSTLTAGLLGLILALIVGLTVAVAVPVGGIQGGDTTAPPQAGIIDGESNALEDVAHTTVRGTGPNQSVGTAVTEVGDVNDDGTPDMAVGAPGVANQTTQQEPGSVSLFFGPAEAGTVETDDADVVIMGEEDSQTGIAVAAADLTGDGHQDVVVGAPAAGADHTGQVAIFHGAALEPGMEVTMADANVTLEGEESAARFGHALATATGILGTVSLHSPLASPGLTDRPVALPSTMGRR
ncbi:MAG: FG-GAP-like repeat-containing protein [Natrialbaceae archaeon]|nr:FG-GAP-like repeat-containing protein [Natrialbaceae archaeon]